MVLMGGSCRVARRTGKKLPGISVLHGEGKGSGSWRDENLFGYGVDVAAGGVPRGDGHRGRMKEEVSRREVIGAATGASAVVGFFLRAVGGIRVARQSIGQSGCLIVGIAGIAQTQGG